MSLTDLTNANEWTLVTEGNVRALIYKEKNKNIRIPIPHININQTLTSTAYAVSVKTTLNKKPTWKYGGLAVVWFPTNVSNEGLAVITQKKLFLDSVNIVIVPRISPNYRLTLYPPSWFWDYHYKIWQYTGSSPPDIYSKLDSFVR